MMKKKKLCAYLGEGGCAGKHGRADKEQEELELPGAGEELEYEDAEYESSQSVDGHSLGFLCVPGGFSGHSGAPKTSEYTFESTCIQNR